MVLSGHLIRYVFFRFGGARHGQPQIPKLQAQGLPGDFEGMKQSYLPSYDRFSRHLQWWLRREEFCPSPEALTS